jgi:hypothetical protein
MVDLLLHLPDSSKHDVGPEGKESSSTRPTQRAATVLEVKAVAVFYSIRKEK